MHVRLVIDAIVRQTTVLIAQLATSAGMRAPLAHIANQTFLSLVGELERQGIGQKVIADMFGLALRSYQQKVQRLSESVTDRGVSLWEAMHGFLLERQVASRADVLRRFARDDQASVRGILNDLVDSGLIYKTGRGDATVYRVAPAEDMEKVEPGAPGEAISALVWVTVYRDGPLGRSGLAERLGLDEAELDSALAELESDGRIRRVDGALGESEGEGGEGESRYTSERCYIALGESAGWEAALLDHYQAVVRAICAKLGQGQTSASASDRTGGSTYSFDVWPGHPRADEVYGLLKELRERVSRLWDEVSQHNHSGHMPADADRVTFYFGQWVQTEGTAVDESR